MRHSSTLRPFKKVSEASLKLLNKCMLLNVSKTFSKSLGLSIVKDKNGEAPLLSILEHSPHLCFRYKVPHSLCRLQHGEKMNLGIGAATALFDDLSTLSFLLYDKYSRPGVSINLSCELLHECPPNTVLNITSKIRKCGKTIGESDY
jgi:hypothetical protein